MITTSTLVTLIMIITEGRISSVVRAPLLWRRPDYIYADDSRHVLARADALCVSYTILSSEVHARVLSLDHSPICRFTILPSSTELILLNMVFQPM